MIETMKRRASSALLLACSLLGIAATPSETPIPEKYRLWVDEEVVCIISDFEREAYLSLADDNARNSFIDAFWSARDPTGGTERNEFREEYGKRVEEANDLFSKRKRRAFEDPRGRLYIQLGAPQFRTRYPMEAGLHPIEHWFYQGKKPHGLPGFFNVLFFKDHGVGKYQLYDPVIDGPEALVGTFLHRRSSPDRRRVAIPVGPKVTRTVSTTQDGGDFRDRRKNALRILGSVNPELRRASLSLDPTDPVTTSGMTFASAGRLVGHLQNLENTQPVDEGYVKRVLEGKVEVEYSFRNLGMIAHFHGAFGDTQAGRLHYSIEIPPESMTLQKHKNLTSGALDVVGRIFTIEDETPVFQIDEHVELSLDKTQAARVRSFPFAFVDEIRLVPGRYRAHLIVRNLLTHDFGTVEGEFEVPVRKPGSVSLGPILIADRTRPPGSTKTEPFSFAGRGLAAGSRSRDSPAERAPRGHGDRRSGASIDRQHAGRVDDPRTDRKKREAGTGKVRRIGNGGSWCRYRCSISRRPLPW